MKRANIEIIPKTNRKMTRFASTQAGKYEAQKELVNTLRGFFPKFTDVFDEETFYIFAFMLVFISIIIAFLLSRYTELKDADFHKD